MSKTATDLLRESYDDVIQGSIPDSDDPWYGYPWFENTRAALAEPAQAAAPDMTDAYAGAREDLSIWKKRALEAEALNRKFAASINSPSFMGEPAAPAKAALADPMQWPLPCDVKVGHVTIRKGCALNTLVTRMQVLYEMGVDAPARIIKAAPVDADVQQDAERLDFLIEQRAYVVSDPSICDGYWLHYARPNGETWVQPNEHTTPRAAIDAARAERIK